MTDFSAVRKQHPDGCWFLELMVGFPHRGDKLRIRVSSAKKQHPVGCCFFGACGRIRTGDRWLLVRMDAGAFRLIFWHSSQYLCSSILHNDALVDAYPIGLCKRGNSRHTKTDKQFTAPVYASKVIDSMVPALTKFNAWLYVSFPLLLDDMILTETLFPHLWEIDETAHRRVEQIMTELLEKNPAPDKSTQQLAWVQHMSSLKTQAEEIVNAELIFC